MKLTYLKAQTVIKAGLLAKYLQTGIFKDTIRRITGKELTHQESD